MSGSNFMIKEERPKMVTNACSASYALGPINLVLPTTLKDRYNYHFSHFSDGNFEVSDAMSKFPKTI